MFCFLTFSAVFALGGRAAEFNHDVDFPTRLEIHLKKMKERFTKRMAE